MEQENSMRAKQSELENSIFKTKQKEVCDIGREGKTSPSRLFKFPNFVRVTKDKKYVFSTFPLFILSEKINFQT